MGGRPTDELAAVVDEVATEVEGAEVVLEVEGEELRASAAELGLRVDRAATLAAVRDARDGLDPLAWVRSLLDPRDAPVIATVDDEALAAVVAERDPSEREPPVEPSVTGDEHGELVVREGRTGRGLDATDVAAAVVDAARRGGSRIEAAVSPGPLDPRFVEADAAALAERARRRTAAPLDVSAGGATASVPTTTLRRWVRSRPTAGGLQLGLDRDAVVRDLEELLPEAGTEAEDAGVRIEAGRPVVVPGRDGTRCCAPEAADAILDALEGELPASRPVELPLAPREPRLTTEEVEDLGIRELVGEFTTRFPAGQSRVVNIHRIADIVRGTLVGPGGRFSVNDKVGRRTTEKGFVPGGVIHDGVFAEDVGGGISQFATTLFNAAFFAGLELEEYQSHSIYISRYPYGREATLSWPKPDLVIGNETPHGVLVWTSYTPTSVTVSLWSTRHATGEQTGQTESPVGNCTRVRTERTRTFVDGRVSVDHVYATYRPEEGVRC